MATKGEGYEDLDFVIRGKRIPSWDVAVVISVASMVLWVLW